MRPLRILLTALGALAVGGCGSMSEYDRPAYPQAPPATAPPVEASPPPDLPEQQAEQVEYRDEYEDTDPTALTDFKPSLDPYGTWVDDPTYGMVWVPSKTVVGEDFAPYVSSGHWAIDTDENYVWVSDHDPTFGWVVFHYGRWVWSSSQGWVWIPGRRYAPAWVVWRVGDPGYDYVGWAPMPPAYYWRSHSVIWLGYYPPAPYVFCETRYVFHDRVHTHIVGRDHVHAVAGQTHPYGSVPPPGNKHTLATPQRGPSPSSGHVPAKYWPESKSTPSSSHAAYSKPSGMGRAPMQAPSAPAAGRRSSRSLGVSDAPQRGPSPGPGAPGGPGGAARGPSWGSSPSPDAPSSPPHYAPPARDYPSQRAPSYSPPPSHSQPPSRVAPPSHSPPPSRVAPSHNPPPARVAPPPSRPPPSAPRAAPPAARPSPPPSRPSPAPSRPSGGGGKRR